MINPTSIRRTVDFAKAQGWIKDPPPRNPGEPCTGKTARHHFKDGICHNCGDLKVVSEKAQRFENLVKDKMKGVK